jgi:hypothetical protein
MYPYDLHLVFLAILTPPIFFNGHFRRWNQWGLLRSINTDSKILSCSATVRPASHPTPVRDGGAEGTEDQSLRGTKGCAGLDQRTEQSGRIRQAGSRGT